MTNRAFLAYVVAPALLVAIFLLSFGFWTGFFLTIHGGIAIPLLLSGLIAVVIFSSVYVAFIEWRTPSSRLGQTVATLPVAALVLLIAVLAYGILAS